LQPKAKGAPAPKDKKGKGTAAARWKRGKKKGPSLFFGCCSCRRSICRSQLPLGLASYHATGILLACAV
jgi:hypothetical protein